MSVSTIFCAIKSAKEVFGASSPRTEDAQLHQTVMSLSFHLQIQGFLFQWSFAWSTVQLAAEAGSRSFTTTLGQLCVTMAGGWLRLKWCVGSWAVVKHCWLLLGLILVKDPDRCGQAT